MPLTNEAQPVVDGQAVLDSYRQQRRAEELARNNALTARLCEMIPALNTCGASEVIAFREYVQSRSLPDIAGVDSLLDTLKSYIDATSDEQREEAITKLDTYQEDNNLQLCDECNRLREDCHYTENGDRMLCDSCYEEQFTNCAQCGSELEISEATIAANGDYICQDCYERHYVTCAECGDVILQDDSVFNEDREETLCCSCAGSEPDGDGGNVAAHKPELIDCRYSKRLPYKIHTSVEIEAEMPSNSTGDEYQANDKAICNLRQKHEDMNLTGDGSLNCGIELRTKPLYGLDFINDIKESCAALLSEGYTVKQTCGLHVHLDATKRTEDEIKRFIRYYMVFEPLLFAMLPPSRQDNHYCKKLNRNFTLDEFDKAKHLDYSLYKTENTGELNRHKRNHYDDMRYHALNFHSYFYRGTVEFRMHNGTLSPEKIIAWVRILHNLYHLGTTADEKQLLNLETYNNEQLAAYFDRYILKTTKMRTYYHGRCNKFAYVNAIKAKRNGGNQ